MTTTDTGPGTATTSSATVRELIAELAQIEDAVRSLPTYVEADGEQVLNPELIVMLDRERHVVSSLRAQDPVDEPGW